MPKIKIGVLGTANIAKKAVIPTLLDLSNHFEIVGVGGRNLQKTKEFCESFDITSFKSYEELIQNPAIQAVYIPLPNALHFEWVIKALERGLHVMCEKSLGCNFEEVQIMVNKAREKKLLLMEHFQFRFHKQVEYIQSRLHEIGEIRTIRTTFGIPPFANENNIRYNKALGGGALLDNGSYPIKIAQVLMSDSIDVEACQLNSEQFDVDIWGNLSIKDSKTGVCLQAAFGFDHVYSCNLEIVGSKGRVYTDRVYTAPPSHRANITLEKQIGYNIEKEQITLPKDNHFKNIWTYFHDMITSQKSFEFEYIQNLNQAKLIDQAKFKSNAK